MQGKYDNIKIQGIVSATPVYSEENSLYQSVLGEKRCKKQIRMTGVSKRRIPKKHQRVSDLCYRAARDLMQNIGWKSDEISVLVFITQGPNYILPSTAFFLQERLGLSKECIAFDVNLGCSSFNMGIEIVSSLLQRQGLGSKGLLLLGDLASGPLNDVKLLETDSVTSRMLFGAAGAATAIEVVEEKEAGVNFLNRSDGNGADAIMQRFGKPSRMDGAAVFEFAVNDVTKCVSDFMNKFLINDTDYDYFVFHQAQKLILDNLVEVCGIPYEKELRSLDEYGNTSGTSIPVSICANQEAIRKQKKVNLICCGFGVGLSWGCVSFSMDTERIYPIIETDEHYDDDKLKTGNFRMMIIGADRNMGKCFSYTYGEDVANLVLVGESEDSIRTIAEQVFLDAEYIVADDKIFENMKKVEPVDCVLFADETMSVQDMGTMLGNIVKQDVLTEDASVLVLADYTYQEQLKRVIPELNIEFKKQHIYMNAIVIPFGNLAWLPSVGDGQEWMEKYLEDDMPVCMKNYISLSNIVKNYMGQQTKYISGQVAVFETEN